MHQQDMNLSLDLLPISATRQKKSKQFWNERKVLISKSRSRVAARGVISGKPKGKSRFSDLKLCCKHLELPASCKLVCQKTSSMSKVPWAKDFRWLRRAFMLLSALEQVHWSFSISLHISWSRIRSKSYQRSSQRIWGSSMTISNSIYTVPGKTEIRQSALRSWRCWRRSTTGLAWQTSNWSRAFPKWRKGNRSRHAGIRSTLRRP